MSFKHRGSILIQALKKERLTQNLPTSCFESKYFTSTWVPKILDADLLKWFACLIETRR